MKELGQKLRDTRERLGITLEEVENATRIRTYHLAALERGDIDSLPSPVQVRGFLGNYADYLGLDSDEILLEYAEKLQSRRPKARTPAALQEPRNGPSVQIHSRRPRWLSFDLAITATIILAVFAILIWGSSRLMQSIRQGGQATDDEMAFLIPSETPTMTNTPLGESTPVPSDPTGETAEEETEIPTQPLVLGLNSEVNLRLVARQRAWVRVLVDDEEVFAGRMLPGEEQTFTGQQSVVVSTGNGAGVRVYYNGQDQGTMGDVGQIVVRVWTLDGVLTPTPTQTLTPTASPPATETPAMSATSPLTPEADL
jgi:cytoskeleton protein RodZ